MTRYRITVSLYGGFEVESKTWWWPFWLTETCSPVNTLAEAEAIAHRLIHRVVKEVTP